MRSSKSPSWTIVNGWGGPPSTRTSTVRHRGAQTRNVAPPSWRLAPSPFIRSNGGARGAGRNIAGGKRHAHMGYPFCLVLHTHLPMVVNHGRWPHGSDWLCEATFECYLPLLDVAHRLLADGIKAKWTLNVSPVLTEQL